MATIKALEGQTVHQIQSGQVIVDLCSVVKELVENSLDAEATSIEVRFKNNGLDSIEVQDNGIGVSSDNYETIALKHYTSKLNSYDDLTSLETFGFRGEALSSLCALSRFHIVTARVDQAPKGTRLEFETSGQLKATSVVASQKGTTVTVENLFLNLPVRRRELEKNIKREYGKVLSLLQSYACISTEARISASNLMANGKKAVAFATKSASTTRENIANVFGTKALPMLVSLNLQFDLRPGSTIGPNLEDKKVQILGHVSKPVFGEGRNAPDRQMFFVNGRPCGLPQVAKVFNEVYKSYNVSQSPFIFANMLLDTNAYDVNASPDKRTIMLHDQSVLLESLRASLTELFEKQDQTVPLTQKSMPNMSASKQPSLLCDSSKKYIPNLSAPGHVQEASQSSTADDGEEAQNDLNPRNGTAKLLETKQKLIKPSKEHHQGLEPDGHNHPRSLTRLQSSVGKNTMVPAGTSYEILAEQPVRADSGRVESSVSSESSEDSEKEPDRRLPQPNSKPLHGAVPNAFERMRPRRQSPEVATITIGSKTMSTVLGGSIFKKRNARPDSPPLLSATVFQENESSHPSAEVSQRMQAFAASGSGILKASGGTQTKRYTSRPQLDDSGEFEVESVKASPSAPSNEKGATENSSESALAEADKNDHQHGTSAEDAESDEDYVDEDEKKAREDAKVAELIRHAEETESVPTIDKKGRAQLNLKGTGNRDPTTELIQLMNTSIQSIGHQLADLESTLRIITANAESLNSPAAPLDTIPPEDRLTLTISKDDFASMHIIGQFNLGFILAMRAGIDIFIIDQHASDEKYNFERLQASTVVQNQRLVHPRRLELTAVDEEIILENNETLLKNGFHVEIDQSGSEPVGQRCKLLSLPISKEITFDTSDLEELIALLADSPPTSSSSTHVPRPSKVRRMFAMRACRSSIMIGKTLTMRQMQGVLKHMGEIDKPWNCPHGRPTMRHLCGLSDWTEWKEGDGLGGMEEQPRPIDWGKWAERAGVSSSDEDGTDFSDGDGRDELPVEDEAEEEEDET